MYTQGHAQTKVSANTLNPKRFRGALDDSTQLGFTRAQRHSLLRQAPVFDQMRAPHCCTSRGAPPSGQAPREIRVRFGSTLYLREMSVSCDGSLCASLFGFDTLPCGIASLICDCDAPASHGDWLGCAVALGAVCGTNCGTIRGAG